MPTFTITADNNITAFESEARVLANTPPDGFEVIATTKKEFDKATANWPIARYAEVWNSFAGVPPFGEIQPVKKFTDRKTAATRIWKTIQVLAEDLLRGNIRDTEAPHAPALAPKKAKPSKQATAKEAAPTAREGSKKAIVLKMMARKGGAILTDIMATTGWQAHTVRGFMAGTLKKAGMAVESSKSEAGERIYRLAK